MPQLEMFGSGLVLIGGTAFIVSLFLHYFNSASEWDITTGLPLLLTVIALTAMGLAMAALSQNFLGLCVGQAVLGAYLLGQAFPIGASSYEFFGTGFWVESIAALAMAIGGVLAVVGNRRTALGRH